MTTVGKTPIEMVEATAPKYIRFGGQLMEQAFIVRSGGVSVRSLFVDVHLTLPAEARVLTVGSPARVVVDLRPGGGSMGTPAEQLFGAQDPAGVVVFTPISVRPRTRFASPATPAPLRRTLSPKCGRAASAQPRPSGWHQITSKPGSL